jgi:surfeit locus 1 family protein
MAIMISSLRWTIHKASTVTALVVLPLLLCLGVWQLQRAEEKRQTQALFAAEQALPPRDLMQLPEQPPQYARLQLRGHYDNARTFLLDNRVLHGRFGYEVLSVFMPVNSSTAVLVNRGWVAGDSARLQRPRITAVEGEVNITGSVYRDTTRIYFVDNAHEVAWPKLIQNLRIDDLQQQLDTPILPFTVRLDADMPGAYHTEWQVVAASFGPERHIAYAVTWFALAFALVIVWLVSNSNITQLIKRNSHDH